MSMKKQLKRPTPYGRFKPSQRPATKVRTLPAQRLPSFAGQEIRYHDVTINADANTTGVILDLSTIPQGDTALLRDGNKTSIKSVELRIGCELEDITKNATIRFLLVIDRQANLAAIPSIGYVLNSIAPSATRNIGFQDRFVVLMDKTFTLNQSASNAAGFQKMFFKKWVKMPECITSFNDGSTAIPTTNSLSLIYFSDLAAGVSDVNVVGQARMRFQG